jgi:serine/threonine protein kinase
MRSHLDGPRGYSTAGDASMSIVGGKWELLAKIGEGAMGAVHKARHVDTRRLAALKQLYARTAELERFKVEARAAAMICHEGIVDVYDAGFDAEFGCYFIVMELLDGEDLRSRFQRPDSTREELLELILKSLDPIDAAHRQNIVHRDLKPENIFVHRRASGGEMVKILDFGIAKAQRETRTLTGLPLGTPLYMSPEQVSDGRRVTASSDVWSIGVMLYEALTRRYPFVGDTQYNIYCAIKDKPHAPVRRLSADVSGALSALVDRCLAKSPDDRFPSVGELAVALRAAMPKRKPKATHKYDVFISCAPEDEDWVNEHLYEPISELEGQDGKRLTVFFQCSGAEPGGTGSTAASGIQGLFDALSSSTKVIPVYSSAYFEQPWATFVLIKAIELDLDGRLGKLAPLLIDAEAAAKIPGVASHIAPETLQSDDWFERLARRLGARLSGKIHLEFTGQPQDVTVHATLEPVEVSLGGATEPARTVAITASSGELQGTLRVQTRGGAARFTDLSFTEPVERATLIATASGAAATESRPFAVKAVRALAVPGDDANAGPRWIAARGEAWFLGSHRLVAVERGRILLFDVSSGERVAELGIAAQPRVLSRLADRCAIADWRGGLLVLEADGRHTIYAHPGGSAGLTIPGAVCVGPEAVFVGYWNGDVMCTATDGTLALLVRHSAGVAALQISAGLIFVADLEGKLAVYRDSRLLHAVELEAPIRLLKAFGDVVIAAGESMLFHVSATGKVLKDRLFLKSIVGAFAESQHPVVVDHEGRGVRLNRELGVVTRFQASPGGRPTAADDAGQWCVLRYDDGSRTLVKGERVVHRQKTGPLSVTQDGARVAIGSESGVRVLDSRELGELEGAVERAG